MSDAEDISFALTPDQISGSKIVLVDDDLLVTSSLENLLFLELDVEAVTFNDPIKALKFLKNNRIDLIISDFLMPELDGIKLLANCRKEQPYVPRILLTGYADKENAIKAINEVQLFQYVQKPWDIEQLKNVVRNGLERHHLVRTLTQAVAKLDHTTSDLTKLRTGLMRAFA